MSVESDVFKSSRILFETSSMNFAHMSNAFSQHSFHAAKNGLPLPWPDHDSVTDVETTNLGCSAVRAKANSGSLISLCFVALTPRPLRHVSGSTSEGLNCEALTKMQPQL